MTVTETGDPDGADPARAGAFTKQATGPASISEWTGQKFARGDATDPTVEHMTVYTDIDAPEPKAFNELNVEAALDLDDVTIGGTANAPTYQLPATNTDGVYNHVTWGSATKPNIVNKTDADDNPDVDSRSFEGYLAGAKGKFMCTGTATTCALNFDEKDMISTLTRHLDVHSR